MMYLYSGAPGSGKSLNAAELIYRWIRIYKADVIVVNMSVDKAYIYSDWKKIAKNKRLEKLGIKYRHDTLAKGKFGKITSIPVVEEFFNPRFLYDYAFKNHKEGREQQTLLVIDESQDFFSPEVVKDRNGEVKALKQSKDYNLPYDDNYRNDWYKFFSQHRHLGFDICFISQVDKGIDSRIRALLEYNYIHLKMNNAGFVGALLTLLRIKMFSRVHYWYGGKMRLNTTRSLLSLKYAKIYNSFNLFAQLKEDYAKRFYEEKRSIFMSKVKKGKRCNLRLRDNATAVALRSISRKTQMEAFERLSNFE